MLAVERLEHTAAHEAPVLPLFAGPRIKLDAPITRATVETLHVRSSHRQQGSVYKRPDNLAEGSAFSAKERKWNAGCNSVV
jgi:hypothetical protein